MPTRNNVRAGTLALISAGFWLAAVAIYVLDDAFDDWSQVDYMLFSAALLLAGILGLLAMIGMSKRLDGLGILGTIGLVVAGVGVAVSFIAWALPLWMGLQGIGYLVFGIAVLRIGIAPRWATLLSSSGFVIGFIAFIALNSAKVGHRDQYGDYPTAWEIAGSLGMVLLALGLIGWGLWLRNEEPADIDTTAVAA